MKNEFCHLRSMVNRQTTAGSLGIVCIALLMFGPRTYDYIRGEPWIDNQISVLRSTDNAVVVEDTIITNTAVYGDRQVVVEDKDGETLCSSRWAGAWNETSRRMWLLPAFVGGCQVPESPFRVCSEFSVYSGSGRHSFYNAFCSQVYDPTITENRTK